MPVAIAVVAGVFVALLAIVLMESAQLFSKAVAQIFSGWHFSILGHDFAFGEHIASFVASEAGRGIKAIETYLDSHVEPLVDAIRGPTNGPKNVIGKILTAIGAAATALRFIRTNRIPALINLINAKYNALRAYAQSLYGQNLNRIYHYYALARGHADHVLQSAVAYATDTGRAAEHYAHLHDTILHDEIIHYYGEAQRYADDDLNKAIHRADTVKVAAESFTIGKVAQAIRYLSDLMSHRLVPLEAKVAANGKTIDTYIDDCGEPLCEGLLNTPPPKEQSPTRGGHGFAKDLPKLWELVEGIAFLGFIEEMIREPVRAADDTFTVADDTVTGTIAAFRDLVGV